MSNEQTAALAQHTSPCRRPSLVLWLFTALTATGIASPAYGSSNESMGPEFSLLIVSYLFLMGVSQAGVVFCAICRLVTVTCEKDEDFKRAEAILLEAGAEQVRKLAEED